MDCFYCQSLVKPPPRDPRNFRCPQCACWNRYDDKGEIISDEPAMHDPDLNARSFARRASPRKDRLLSSYGNGVFCHTCQNNQMLLTNLLSNYLPDPDDPDYDKRVEMLPEYQASVERRYPPVCATCFPAVEEEIRNRNRMARTNALGRWLKESKGKKKQVAAVVNEPVKIDRDIRIWKLRGCLWVFCLVASILVDATAALTGYRIWSAAVWPTRLLPVPAVAAFAAVYSWNPTYAPIKRAKHQGRDLRLEGGRTYLICQILIWVLRLTTCSFLSLSTYKPRWNYLQLAVDVSSPSRLYFATSLTLELLIVTISLSSLRVHRPPEIRLIDPNGRSSSAPPLGSTSDRSKLSVDPPGPPQEADLFASLSLSTTPVIRTNPIFGLPSLHQTPSTPIRPPHNEDDPDAMDWTPTNPSPKKGPFVRDYREDTFLKPQMFFPPEEPTGLERLLAQTNLVEAPVVPSSRTPMASGVKWPYYWFCALLVVPAVATAYLYLRAPANYHSNTFTAPEPDVVTGIVE